MGCAFLFGVDALYAALPPWYQLEEVLDRAQMNCAPPAPTKTDRATAQLATKLSLKLVFFIVASLVCCALVRVRCLLLVGISPSNRTVRSVF